MFLAIDKESALGKPEILSHDHVLQQGGGKRSLRKLLVLFHKRTEEMNTDGRRTRNESNGDLNSYIGASGNSRL